MYSSSDVDVNATQEILVGGAARNPLLDFCTLSDYVTKMKQVYTDKMDAMDHEDLNMEATSEAFLEQIAVTSENCSVFNL